MNKPAKYNVESVEGEYLTENEYRFNQTMKLYNEQMAKLEERNRINRQREREVNIAMMQIRLKHSIALAEALHQYEVKKNMEYAQEIKSAKEIDKALMLVFLIIGAAIIRIIFF